jgi:hypothetical protein
MIPGIRYLGHGPNPENDPPEPYFESGELAMQGMAEALRPELVARERRVSETISRLVGRLFRYALADCLKNENESLVQRASELKAKAESIDDAGLSDGEKLAEIALRDTGDILEFKKQVYAVRNAGVENAVPSTKLDEAVEEAKRLRMILGYAA